MPDADGYVLLLEDDPDIIEALDLLFTSEGIAYRKSEGEFDVSTPPSVALLDLSLGGAIGPIARTLAGLKVPIVVTSASPDAKAVADRIGAAACLQKPFDLENLLLLLRRLVPSLGKARR